jgi:hypothetical protein
MKNFVLLFQVFSKLLPTFGYPDGGCYLTVFCFGVWHCGSYRPICMQYFLKNFREVGSVSLECTADFRFKNGSGRHLESRNGAF